MRIVVNDIAASKGGAITVLTDFYNSVKANDSENEWIFLLGDKYLEETDNIKIIVLKEIKNNRIKKLIFDFFTGRKFIKKLNPDVIFSMQNTAVFGLKIPQIMYLHQAVPFQRTKRFSFFKSAERSLAVYQHLISKVIKKSVKVCDKVIVQTRWMKDAICQQCRMPDEKILHILPTVADISGYNTSKPFKSNTFFYPTAPVIYKNNTEIFEACEILDKKELDYDVMLTLPESYSKNKIRCVGRIPYGEVIEKYAESTLVFPSYIETFGFPMAEARKIGTVVFASNCPFSREILDGYENAYFFDPFKPEELAVLMERVISGDIVKKPSSNVADSEDCWKKVLQILLNAKNTQK